MDAEKLIAALETYEDITVSSTELNGVVELMVRHTATLWRGKHVTIENGIPFWSSEAGIRPGPNEDADDPTIIARIIHNAVAPDPTLQGSAYL